MLLQKAYLVLINQVFFELFQLHLFISGYNLLLTLGHCLFENVDRLFDQFVPVFSLRLFQRSPEFPTPADNLLNPPVDVAPSWVHVAPKLDLGFDYSVWVLHSSLFQLFRDLLLELFVELDILVVCHQMVPAVRRSKFVGLWIPLADLSLM